MIGFEKLILEVSAKLKGHEQIDNPDLEARWIIEAAIKATGDKGESPDLDLVHKLTNDRLEGIPLAYVLGEKEFYGINFKVNPNVLIPRPETEHLVDLALDWIKRSNLGHFRIVDFGSGSGCLGLSILAKNQNCKLCSVDINEQALMVSQENADRLNFNGRTNFVLKDAAKFLPSHLPSDFSEKADLIVANPPYISEDDPAIDPWVKSYEPHIALFSDEDGLGDLRRWLSSAKLIFGNPSMVIFEIGSRQANSAKKIAQDIFLNFSGIDIQIHKDYSGNDRVLTIERTT